MLRDRLISSALILVCLTVLIYVDAKFLPEGSGGIALLPAVLAFGLGTAFEYQRMVAASDRPIRKTPFLIAVGMVLLLSSSPLWWPLAGAVYPDPCPIGRIGWPLLGMLAAVFALVSVEVLRFGLDAGSPIDRLAYAVLGLIWIAMPLGYLIVLRQLGQDLWGLAALLWLLAVTKSADAGAFGAGRVFGRHKLLPRVSPGKTWEGLCGGWIAAMLVSWFAVLWLTPNGNSMNGLGATALPAAALGSICTVAGLLGDLSESMIKRIAGAKDSGAILPGLGGFWDVTDSLLATAIPGTFWFASWANQS